MTLEETLVKQQEIVERQFALIESQSSSIELLCRMNLELMNMVQVTFGLAPGLKQPDVETQPDILKDHATLNGM